MNKNKIRRQATIRLPYPHTGQQHVMAHAKRFNYLAAGRRWRKSTLFVALAIQALLQNKRVIWGAPVSHQCRIGWDECAYASNGVLNMVKSPTMTITCPGRSGFIVFVSLEDPNNARGLTGDLVLIDEAPLIRPEAWYEVLLPMISDTRGDAWLGGTPNGYDFFFKEHSKAKSLEDSMSYQIPTCGAYINNGQLVRSPHPQENPEFPFEELMRQFEAMPENSFRQEFLSEFLTGGGIIFRNVEGRATAERQDRAIPGHQYVMAVDLAKMNDWTYIGVGDLTLKHLVYTERFNQIDYTLQYERIRSVYDRFSQTDPRASHISHPVSVLVPVAGPGEPVLEQLQRMELPVQPYIESNASNKIAVEALSVAFERDADFAIINDPVLIAEHKAYTAKKLVSGLLRYEAPSGEHDDSVSMMRMLWQVMKGYTTKPRVLPPQPQRLHPVNIMGQRYTTNLKMIP